MALLVRLIAVALAATALGCATGSDDFRHEWTKPGTIADDLVRDRYNCMQDAQGDDLGSLASLSVGASGRRSRDAGWSCVGTASARGQAAVRGVHGVARLALIGRDPRGATWDIGRYAGLVIGGGRAHHGWRR